MGLHWGAILHLRCDATVVIDWIEKTGTYDQIYACFRLHRGGIRDMYRMCISVGDRDGGPGIEVLRAHLLWVRKAQELSIVGPSLGDSIIPGTGMHQVPGIFFVTVVYIARNMYTQYVPGTALGATCAVCRSLLKTSI